MHLSNRHAVIENSCSGVKPISQKLVGLMKQKSVRTYLTNSSQYFAQKKHLEKLWLDDFATFPLLTCLWSTNNKMRNYMLGLVVNIGFFN